MLARGAGVIQVLGVNQELVSCRGCLAQLGHKVWSAEVLLHLSLAE